MLGVTEDMVEAIADSTLVMQGGYHVLMRDEIVTVLRASSARRAHGGAAAW